jgi:protoheme ferro-lyase
MTDDFNKEEMDWIVAFRSVIKLMPQTITMYDLDGTTIYCKRGISSRVLSLPIAFMEEHFDILSELHEYHDKENDK